MMITRLIESAADKAAALVLREVDAGACVPGFGTFCACRGDGECHGPNNVGDQYFWNCFGDCWNLHCTCCC
jgi:hypothetical protein